MQIGMIGLGRMGGNMVARLLAAGHECHVFDLDRTAIHEAERYGAKGAASIDDLVRALEAPRVAWIMIPAARVDAVLGDLVARLGQGDIVVDGGNSHYEDAIRRAAALGEHGVRFLDVGVSGGVWGRELGYCQMIGGERESVDRLEPVFAALATGEKASSAHLHCGPSGAGHFVKMVHNGIEYGLMQAYAEGFNMLEQAGQLLRREAGEPEDTNGVLDVAAIAEVWRHGSVIRSWLLDLAARALAEDPKLTAFTGAVADSGEGRWALETAIEQRVPVPVLAAALFARFDSRGGGEFAHQILSALRHLFGGHHEPPQR